MFHVLLYNIKKKYEEDDSIMIIIEKERGIIKMPLLYLYLIL